MADETNIGTLDAGAAPVTGTAEGQGNQGDETSGADTQDTATAEEQAGQADEIKPSEGAEGTMEGTEAEAPPPDKGAHQTTLEERALEIAERRFAELLEKSQPTAPPFIPIDYDAYDNNIAKMIAREEQIRSELALEPDDAVQLVKELRILRGKRDELEGQFSYNEQKKKEWEGQQAKQKEHDFYIGEINKGINHSAPLVAEELGISPEAWAAGEKWFIDQRKANKGLQAEYYERCLRDGPYRALKWAAEFTRDGLGKANEAARNKREAGKEVTIGAGSESGGDSFANVHSYADLMKLPGKEINLFYKNHPKRFAELKTKHFK